MPTDIQNSERLLDLSNQLNDSINERKKLLKESNAEEQQYLAVVKQQQKLSQDIAANAEKYLGYQIKSKDLAKQIKATEDNIAKSKFAYSNIEKKLNNDRAKAISKIKDLYQKEIAQKKDINNLEGQLSQKISQRNAAEIRGEKEIAAQLSQEIKEETRIIQAKEKSLEKIIKQKEAQISLSNATKDIIKKGKESLQNQEKELAFLRENEKIRKRIEKSTGLLGAFSKSLSKIPGIGQYLNADEAIDEMEKLAATIEEAGGKATSFSNRLKIGLRGATVLAKGFYENIKSPEAVFTFLITQAAKANKQTVELGKSLGYGVGRADAFRERIADIARFSSNVNFTTENLVEAFGQLVQATGFAYEYTADQLKTQVKLTKQVGLQAEDAAQVQKFAVLTGKTSEETYRSFVRGLTTARNQLKVGIDFKSTLAEALKVSGQLAANLGYNPERISKAIVAMKAFGTTLEQTKNQAEALLNFETSIENELKAELLTGEQLNLERARAAALQGDQVALAKELASQGMTLEKFQKMNVLAQKSYAEAIGLSADALSDQLQKQKLAQESGKSLAQITEEEAKQALERQAVQEKFNQAILKLQDFFGNLVAGPFGTFLDMLSSSLGLITSIGAGLATWYATSKLIAGTQALITWYSRQKLIADRLGVGVGNVMIAQLGRMLGLSTAKAVAETTAATALSFGTILPIILGAGAAIYGLIQSFKGNDIMSEGGYGKRTLLAPEGAIRLNDKDTVIAGTNLGGGGGEAISPSIDLTPMIAAINEVKSAVDRLYSKDTSISMDGKKVGTTLTQGSYKPA